MSHHQSLREVMEDFQAKRVATMDPNALKISAGQRSHLIETKNKADFVKAGDLVPDFVLEEVGGARLTRDSLLASGPLVMIFFRFAGCPVCNVALPYYDRELAPTLAELGVGLIAISPQVPERLVEIKEKHGFSFPVATDRDNRLSRYLGILYSYDEPSRQAAIANGKPIGEVTGTGTWELPMPAIVIVDRNCKVIFSDVSPDWMIRTEPESVLAAVRGLLTETERAPA
ncbi:peroxiredoxin-like family protein [Mesorhizobium sp. YR577]|uniref:peroxiredoxin-like family protein n=1 Tax=Mesorhizobium sp. YR577 TaxID=1884373 RepID=UPI0008E04BB1|nr:peroxiredoxin-like family protein [Mesorhizobium sp. YR577]SFU21800.1 Peroxiredoxin [Mesorhizobium sp. YR577]